MLLMVQIGRLVQEVNFARAGGRKYDGRDLGIATCHRGIGELHRAIDSVLPT